MAAKEEKTNPFTQETGVIHLGGIDAIVRLTLDQVRTDARRGLKTGMFVSGYRGSPVGMLDRVDAAELAANLAVNLVAPAVLMRRFLHAAATAAKRRRVINISSGAGRRPIFGWGAYCAAKAGLDMLTRVAALEAQALGACLAEGVQDH